MENIKIRYNEKLERNISIYQDRLSGLSWSALMKKYDLGQKTLQNIVKVMVKKHPLLVETKL